MTEFNEQNEIIVEKTIDAVLVGVSFGKDISDSMKELEALAGAAGANILGVMEQSRERPVSATYIGKGKVQELADFCAASGADTVIFNNELSGAQIRNLEEATGVSVIDRTILILDIFASRALSASGRLEVELAQLKYRLPRLTGFGRSLSRTGGGIGTRGPGEKKLETDRRHIQSRIDDIRRELRDAERTREVMRRKRAKAELPSAALVGYTNSGKSTLMNCLLQSGDHAGRTVTEKDMLFATLDVSSRNIQMEGDRSFILSDTVGFVSRLPHTLVDAFKATLEETTGADLILEVVDASDADCAFKMSVTERLLEEIGAGDIPRIVVYNKVDLLLPDQEVLHQAGGPCQEISARTGEGIPELLEKMREVLFADEQEVSLLIPYHRGDISSYLFDQCSVQESEYLSEGIRLRVFLGRADRMRLAEFLEDKNQ